MFVFFIAIIVHYLIFLYSSISSCDEGEYIAIPGTAERSVQHLITRVWSAGGHSSSSYYKYIYHVLYIIYIYFLYCTYISLPEYGVLEVTPPHHWHQTRNEKESLKRNYFHNILFPLCSSNLKPFSLRCGSTSVLRAFTWKSFPREMSFHLIPMVIAKCHHHTSYLSFFIQPQFETKKFYTWKCINLRQKFSRNKTVRLCVEQFFRVHIGQFYNWLNYFTQPAVVMAMTNMSCSHHSLPLKAQKHRENCKSQCQCLLMLMS